jgi:NAD(P)-dependent dehydrogenase (short-subunit alcohol dehydrogenase family)
MELDLKGKKAIITGASRGIGKAIAFEFASEGMDLAICSRSLDAVQKTANEITQTWPVKVFACQADTRNTEETNSFVNQSISALNGINILVNNAAAPGGLVMGPLQTADPEELLDDINTKVVGYLRASKAIAPHLIESGWGRIINIGGLAARSGGAISGMRNLALIHLTKTLSLELAPNGINVNIIHPGITKTERSDPMYEEQAKKQGISVKKIILNATSGLDTRLMPDATDIANLATFLASEKANAITGESIAAGGGVGSGIFI